MFGFFEGKVAELYRTLAPEESPEEKLMGAIARGDLGGVQLLMQQHGFSATHRNANGNQPIHVAAYNGQAGCVQWLLERGADARAVGQRGNTCLHFAAVQGHLELVKLFIQLGCSVLAKNEMGKTPYDAAESFGVKQFLMPLMFSEEQRTGTAPVILGATVDLRKERERLANLAPPPKMGDLMGAPPMSSAPPPYGGFPPPPQQMQQMQPPPPPPQQQQQQQQQQMQQQQQGGLAALMQPLPMAMAGAPQPYSAPPAFRAAATAPPQPFQPVTAPQPFQPAATLAPAQLLFQPQPQPQQPSQPAPLAPGAAPLPSATPPLFAGTSTPPYGGAPTPPPYGAAPTPPPGGAPAYVDPNARPNSRAAFKPDGFVTTVGNPELAAKYGNKSSYRPVDGPGGAGAADGYAAPAPAAAPSFAAPPTYNPALAKQSPFAKGRYVTYDAQGGAGQPVQYQQQQQSAQPMPAVSMFNPAAAHSAPGFQTFTQGPAVFNPAAQQQQQQQQQATQQPALAGFPPVAPFQPAAAAPRSISPQLTQPVAPLPVPALPMAAGGWAPAAPAALPMNVMPTGGALPAAAPAPSFPPASPPAAAPFGLTPLGDTFAGAPVVTSPMTPPMDAAAQQAMLGSLQAFAEIKLDESEEGAFN